MPEVLRQQPQDLFPAGLFLDPRFLPPQDVGQIGPKAEIDLTKSVGFDHIATPHSIDERISLSLLTTYLGESDHVGGCQLDRWLVLRHHPSADVVPQDLRPALLATPALDHSPAVQQDRIRERSPHTSYLHIAGAYLTARLN